MSITVSAPVWFRLTAGLALCVILASCGTAPERTLSDNGSWGGRPIGTPPHPNARVKQLMISGANREWEFFGRQTVVLRGAEESIPHVGLWEDDDTSHSDRVGAYWRAAGKGRLNGMDCREPWSAAFMSWIMQGAGVPEGQFRRDSAHWVYLADMIEESYFPGRWFVPRRVGDYSPAPGDLICASRGPTRPATLNGYTSARALQGLNLHCDLVVGKDGQRLESIGGNVRNSVSKSTLELDGQGHLQPVPRRPWFLIMENRL
ncbi:MAG TPA: DUF2272 domain-containing protein [Lamprocystis sp. (in: g-proteobacteria)]|nr:DUF2272 domain-containing protein [Lamprocystis sp. (in: g-proteobacteria)]